jgi:hypothetical protein
VRHAEFIGQRMDSEAACCSGRAYRKAQTFPFRVLGCYGLCGRWGGPWRRCGRRCGAIASGPLGGVWRPYSGSGRYALARIPVRKQGVYGGNYGTGGRAGQQRRRSLAQWVDLRLWHLGRSSVIW